MPTKQPDELVIRHARADEAGAITALNMRSKAHWGYDAAFMEQCRDVLTVDAGWLAASQTHVAEIDGVLVGTVAIEPDEDDPAAFEIDNLFVDPAFMGRGVGRRLFDVIADIARKRGAKRLTILSDPNAADFYRRMGAQFVEMRPSDAIAGRELPLFALDLE